MEKKRTYGNGNSRNDFESLKLFVVIPAYQCEKTIETVISRIPKFISKIVVVDDKSPDNLIDIINRFKKVDKRLVLLSHQTNQGVGAATLTGYKYSLENGADYIIKMDSDDQMDPEYIIPLIKPLIDHQADYVKGNRYLYLKQISKMPFIRRIGNFVLSILAKMASGYWNVFDFTNGFTAINSRIIKFLDFSKIDKRYFFENSLLVELGLEKACVMDIYVPVIYKDEKSNLSEADSLLRFPFMLFSGMVRRIFIQYIVRDFNASTLFLLMGLLLTTFGLIFGINHWWISSQTGVAATTGQVMIAFLPFFLGIQFLLQFLILDINNVPKEPRIRYL